MTYTPPEPDVAQADEPVRFRGAEGQILRGFPHLLVGIALAWLLCIYVGGTGVAAVVAAGVATLAVSLFWWFVLWPVQQTEIVGSVYTSRGRYGTSRIDLADVTDISVRWIPYSGTWLAITTEENEIQILRSRYNRRELLAIGDVIRETQGRRVFSTRVERALGLGAINR